MASQRGNWNQGFRAPTTAGHVSAITSSVTNPSDCFRIVDVSVNVAGTGTGTGTDTDTDINISAGTASTAPCSRCLQVPREHWEVSQGGSVTSVGTQFAVDTLSFWFTLRHPFVAY
jgi:hypothetical protein